MNVRTRLTVIFSLIVFLLLTGISLAIYFFSADYRKEDFYQRLKRKAVNTAKILIAVEEVNADLLRRIERDNPSKLPNEHIVIFNYKNEEIYSSDTEDTLQVSKEELDRIRLEGEIRFVKGNYEALGFLFVEKFDRFAVVAVAEDIYGLGKLKNLRVILMLTFAISVLVVPVSGWIYAGRMLTPVAELAKQAEMISASKMDRRLITSNKEDEFGKLTETMNFMLDRLEQAFNAQKQFISNASHELRTPLTSIRGELEVTLGQKREAERYEDVLRSVLDEIKALSHLSNQLLLLAQASTESPIQVNSPCRIDEILWQLKEEFSKKRPDCSIDIEMDQNIDDESLTVAGDEQLLKTSFLNLIDNGCKYSNNMKVKVMLKRVSDHIQLIFENEGVEIAEAELATIFNPFYRGKNARGIKGSGIGLSLVQRIIVYLHSGDLQVKSINGATSFTVLLPIQGIS